MRQLRTLLRAFMVVIAAAVAGSCGSADTGFLAPTGSTVTVSGPTSAPTNGSDFFVAVTATVKLQSGEFGNGVQLRFICSKCEIRDSDPAGDAFGTPPGETVATANPYIVKTSSQGNYALWIRVSPPSAIGESSYSAVVTADIGVGTGSLSIAVSE
jgi:hypothetical protein